MRKVGGGHVFSIMPACVFFINTGMNFFLAKNQQPRLEYVRI